MKLLLTSEGITNPSIAEALLGLLGKPFEKSRAACVPTAANGETGDKSWVEVQTQGIRNLGFSEVDVVDISKVPEDVWRASFQKADVLVFGGGNVNYLLTWLHKSGVSKVLPDLLKTRVYVGISAGSMVTARNLSMSEAGILYYEQTGTFKNMKGLGFVDFEIRPHLNISYFPNVRIEYLAKLAAKNPTPFYAIDDNTAVKVDGDTVSVVSEGKWKKFN